MIDKEKLQRCLDWVYSCVAAKDRLNLSHELVWKDFPSGVVGDAVQWTSPLVTGGLAAWIFYFYRQDRKDARERHGHLMERYHTLAENLLETVKCNTAAITELIVVVKRLNGIK